MEEEAEEELSNLLFVKMKSIAKYKKAQIGQLPGFFQVMMLVVIFAGLTFIVLDKFLNAASVQATAGNSSLAYKAINETTWNLYDYGIGFLGIVILVVMVYLIISIVSGRGKAGAR